MRATGVRPSRRPRRVGRSDNGIELAVLAANVPGAIYRCALDATWTMSMITDEIERISGYPSSDFIDNACRTFASVIHPEDHDEVEREVRAATDANQPFALEYRIVRADGTIAWVLERGQQIVEADGQAWLHGVIFDITERKLAEEALRRQEAERARVEELKAARARIIAAQDEARRAIERNLHDGAQQRLVTLSLTLRMVKAKLAEDPKAAADLLDAAIDGLAEATAELRELARGIHPAVLTDKGLPAAVETLADRAPVPVELHCSLQERLPGHVEAAAYYVVAEALTNVARYANARKATVHLARRNGSALIEVVDDGIGGANLDAGSGLRGLNDRIDALEGSLEVSSEPGAGTRVRVEIPLD